MSNEIIGLPPLPKCGRAFTDFGQIDLYISKSGIRTPVELQRALFAVYLAGGQIDKIAVTKKVAKSVIKVPALSVTDRYAV